MSWSRITGGNNGGADFTTATSVSQVLGGAVSVSDLVFVVCSRTSSTDDAASDTCADNLGNTYTQGGNGWTASGTGGLAWFYSFVTVAGTPTVTVTFPNSKTNRAIAAHVYRSSLGVPSFDQSYTIPTTSDLLGGGPDNLFTGTSITPTVDGCLVVAGFGQFSNLQTFSAGTGYTEDQDTGVAFISYLSIESFFQVTAAAKQGLGTDSGTLGRYLGYVASFKEPSSSRSLALLGVG